MTTCAEAIRELFKNNKNQVLTTKQIIDSVGKKYPSKWKEVTIRTHTVGCSINHTSSRWYPSFPKFLYTVSPGKVRLYNRGQDGEFIINSEAEPEDILTERDALEVTLSLERDMQEYLSRDLSQLEIGLKLYIEEELTGCEVSTEAGKIDILARDNKNNFVVIELKASRASYSALGQILSYMASIKKELGLKSLRGIIVAEDFDRKLCLAVTEVSNVSLVKYKVKFDFQKVG